MSSSYPQTELTRVRRMAARAHYDRATVQAILDTGWICHVGFTVDGQAHCIPTAHWRVDDTLYIHGSNGSRLLKALADGARACVCVAQVDGLVLARSAFHHSMNYRSAMVYGQFRVVDDEAEKWASLAAFMDKIAPGRRQEVRMPDDNEFAATTVLALDIVEAVAKMRSGPPKDDEADMAIPVWAGVRPLETRFGTPIPDPAMAG
ncbi:pyridoxamine 5'-phosphate oxidase family protein [Chitinimonas sp.]|uniref:pyridoxamine 5'-phosphate oxidase family protein n=1 Tax=Chitinimonas sp. TaxID=1934313 RepID=UPI002F92E032